MTGSSIPVTSTASFRSDLNNIRNQFIANNQQTNNEEQKIDLDEPYQGINTAPE